MRRQGCSTGNLSRIGRRTELGAREAGSQGALRTGGETKALGELQALATVEPAVMRVNTCMCAHGHTGRCMHRHMHTLAHTHTGTQGAPRVLV